MIFVIAAIEIDIVRVDDTCHANQQEHFRALKTPINNITVEDVRIFIRRQTVL
jgi:hypothetical protein